MPIGCQRQSKSGPKGSAKCCHFGGWGNQRVDERQHPGGRACHIAGGCPDALARQGQSVLIVI